MKSHRAENEARENITRPQVTIKLLVCERINEADNRHAAEVALAKWLMEGWQVITSGLENANVVYTLARVTAPEPTRSPVMAVG